MKIEKVSIDALQININNQISLIFARNTLQVVINVNKEFLINRKRLYI